MSKNCCQVSTQSFIFLLQNNFIAYDTIQIICIKLKTTNNNTECANSKPRAKQMSHFMLPAPNLEQHFNRCLPKLSTFMITVLPNTDHFVAVSLSLFVLFGHVLSSRFPSLLLSIKLPFSARLYRMVFCVNCLFAVSVASTFFPLLSLLIFCIWCESFPDRCPLVTDILSHLPVPITLCTCFHLN